MMTAMTPPTAQPITASFWSRLQLAFRIRLIVSQAKMRRKVYDAAMDEGRKRVIGIMAAILASLHMLTADDLFGGAQGSPRADKVIAASVELAGERRGKDCMDCRGSL